MADHKRMYLTLSQVTFIITSNNIITGDVQQLHHLGIAR